MMCARRPTFSTVHPVILVTLAPFYLLWPAASPPYPAFVNTNIDKEPLSHIRFSLGVRSPMSILRSLVFHLALLRMKTPG